MVEYSETQKKTEITLSAINRSLETLNKNMNAMNEKLSEVSEQAKKLDEDMTKVKSGLQKELFSSLQALHDKYCPGLGRGWASSLEKSEAKMFYDEIHSMGQNGWSTQTFKDIYTLPESEKEMYMRAMG